ncbi:MAG: CDP-diacylglycerol--glycerol-3-phosphate 3-phosphatidyltransferase [Clostridiales bacterium]|nr:CDP-diacylglycerol--glycerol-3-phosphate 3-phosphatidyltransferase [Clostridiales bacterium]
MTLPNMLTIARIVLTVPFMALAMQDNTPCKILALVIFIAAAITDSFDGRIARKRNLITTFGKIMDPLADKLLTTAAFLVFTMTGRMNVYALMLIIAREFSVTSLRVVAADEGKIIAAGKWGKIKTVMQFVYIIIVLVNIPGYLFHVEQILMWIVTAVTIYSGIDYFMKNRELIKLDIDKK